VQAFPIQSGRSPNFELSLDVLGTGSLVCTDIKIITFRCDLLRDKEIKERAPRFASGRSFYFQIVSRLPAVSLFAIAVAAVHRPVATGLERYFGRFAALGTGYREHLMTSRRRAGA
jgi:hypothetical protein